MEQRERAERAASIFCHFGGLPNVAILLLAIGPIPVWARDLDKARNRREGFPCCGLRQRFVEFSFRQSSDALGFLCAIFLQIDRFEEGHELFLVARNNSLTFWTWRSALNRDEHLTQPPACAHTALVNRPDFGN